MEYTVRPAKQQKRGKGNRAAIDTCQFTHCPLEPDHCTRQECRQRLNSEQQSLEGQKLALSFSLEARVAETKRLSNEIQEECKLDALSDDNMASCFASFTAGIAPKVPMIACKCPECKKDQASAELELINNRLAVALDWLAALREYRSSNDLEAVRRPTAQSTKYFSDKSYFQRVGSYRGHGAAATKPRLQMQHSYNVAGLIRNDMKARPLKQVPPKKENEKPKQPKIPALRESYTRQEDSSVLVHDGSYTALNNTKYALNKSRIRSEGLPVVSQDMSEEDCLRDDLPSTKVADQQDVKVDEGFDCDDLISSKIEEKNDGKEDEAIGWGELMDNLVL